MKRNPDEPLINYRERIKETALNLKEYLKGKIVPGTESYSPRIKGRKMQCRSSEVTANLYRQKKAKRNKLRKIAYASKKKNK